MRADKLVVIRGGGDLATGVAQKFWRSGFKLLVLEIEQPTAIRRSVTLCEAVYTGYTAVEDVTGKHISATSEINACLESGSIPVLIDPDGACIAHLQPALVIDAILAKRNQGTHRAMASITIGLGPGFCAGEDVDVVIETMRGHDLGRLIVSGSALPDTGIPGEIGGKSAQRVLHAPVAGKVSPIRRIGDIVGEGEALCEIAGEVIRAPFTGLLRGLIRDGLSVSPGMKIADIDPRTDVDWHTISDKARCIGGAALEAFLWLDSRVK